MILFLPFATKKNVYVQTKNLPEPKKITRAALGLLGTFSMSDYKIPNIQTLLEMVCTHYNLKAIRIWLLQMYVEYKLF